MNWSEYKNRKNLYEERQYGRIDEVLGNMEPVHDPTTRYYTDAMAGPNTWSQTDALAAANRAGVSPDKAATDIRHEKEFLRPEGQGGLEGMYGAVHLTSPLEAYKKNPAIVLQGNTPQDKAKTLSAVIDNMPVPDEYQDLHQERVAQGMQVDAEGRIQRDEKGKPIYKQSLKTLKHTAGSVFRNIWKTEHPTLKQGIYTGLAVYASQDRNTSGKEPGNRMT